MTYSKITHFFKCHYAYLQIRAYHYLARVFGYPIAGMIFRGSIQIDHDDYIVGRIRCLKYILWGKG